MQTIKLPRGNAHTFLTHLFGRGLDDDRYRVERFQSMADGEIHPARAGGPSKKVRGKASRGRLATHRPADATPAR